jgi:hypothetical protein
MSSPERRLVLADRNGPVTDQPDWVSVDVLVEFELEDDASARRWWVSPSEAKWQRGGPLDCSRHELEADIRDLVFSEPTYTPGDPRASPALVVEELRRHGVDATSKALAALPFTVELAEDVEAARAAQTNARPKSD